MKTTMVDEKQIFSVTSDFLSFKNHIYILFKRNVVKTKGTDINTYRMCFGYSIKKAQLYLQFWP